MKALDALIGHSLYAVLQKCTSFL